MKILVDTNILLRAIQHENPLCAVVRKALKILHPGRNAGFALHLRTCGNSGMYALGRPITTDWEN